MCVCLHLCLSWAPKKLLMLGFTPSLIFFTGQHPASTKDLALVAPTADQITMRLKDGNALAYAERLESWNIGLVSIWLVWCELIQ